MRKAKTKPTRQLVAAADLLSRFSPEQRAQIAARAEELIAEALTYRDLRKARDRTQTEIAQVLGVGQEHVSRIEQRTDMLLSTLAGYVEAMGGSLKLVATFPDRPPVTLSTISDVFEHEPYQRPARRRPKTARKTPSAEGKRAARPAT